MFGPQHKFIFHPIKELFLKTGLVGFLTMWIMLILTANLNHYSVQAFPEGAPTSVCDSMEPNPRFHGHSLVEGTRRHPFRILVSARQVKAGKVVAVKIVGPVGYKGILLQARNNQTGKIMGRFIRAKPGIQIISCFPGTENAVTHDGTRADLSKTVYFWQAPQRFRRGTTIAFVATIVVRRNIYYTRQFSTPIRLIM